jgi:predicted Fe-Mo cluster-binding NifX family protein
MKIAISSQGTNLDAQVDPQFGRCQYFMIVDPATEAFEVLNNEAAAATGGAGIQAAQIVANAGVDAVITGNLGPNATNVLKKTGIQTYLGISGTIREALKQCIEGQSQKTSAAAGSPPPRTAGAGRGGQAPGSGQGRGRGMGRGGGGGRGRGLGIGPAGECVCPNCGARSAHQAGVPCFNTTCPQCGTPMRGN